MSKFDKFKGKGNSQKGCIVRINKYESKGAVLDLISRIATAQDEFDIRLYFRPIAQAVSTFVETEKNKTDFYDIDKIIDELDWDIDSILHSFVDRLESNHGIARITIAVGGGYSSGKSSFLNHISGLGNLLPTGIEPVSIVNTMLTYSKDAKNLIIRGKNFKDAYVRLDKDVLQSIQHASKSKVYVASVLENILIDIPKSEEFLDNVTFIDTPGYNNSPSKNLENAKTDLDTAMEGMINADAFIWCIDMEAGTIPSKDLDMIKKILDEGGKKPYVILFTKRDKKDIKDQRHIILEASRLAQKYLPYMPDIILGFSTIEENPYLAAGGKDIVYFIKSLRNRRGPTDLKLQLWNSFKSAIDECEKKLLELKEKYESTRLELSKEKSRLSDVKQNAYHEAKKNKRDLEEFIHDHYEELLQVIHDRNALLKAIYNNCNALLSVAMSKLSIGLGKVALNKYDFPEGCSYYNKECRSAMLNFLNTTLDDYVENIRALYTSKQKQYEECFERKRQTERCIGFLQEFRTRLYKLSNNCFDSFSKDIKNHYDGMEMPSTTSGDIFSAIASDNIGMFTSCLSEGVDFSLCNNTGYNPLTYIAHCGNSEMMKYLIDHDVDLSLKDNRGYTAFETAVIAHYKDICELILKKDPTAKYTDSPLSVLSEKNTFNNWINQI